jgi:hypothetical protein
MLDSKRKRNSECEEIGKTTILTGKKPKESLINRKFVNQQN